MQQMSDKKGRLLAKIARNAIEGALGANLTPDPEGAWLRDPAATFVTLTRFGELHGCIGSIEARRSLIEDIKQNAIAAALYDPRATPLSLGSVNELGIEISILSPLEPIDFIDEADALASLRPNIDGVVFVYGSKRATFLPQVWESLPDVAEFMGHLKQKAGLPADFWSPNVKLYRYVSEKWKEPAPASSHE